jgi:intein/homing endonuclease
MNIKYPNVLTKELLEPLYNQFGSALGISKHLNIPTKTIIEYLDKHQIKRKVNDSYEINHNVFSSDTEISFYLAGFIAADGCIGNKEPRLAIDLAAKDKDHLLKISKILSPNKTLKASYATLKSTGKTYEIWRFSISSKIIINDLLRFNIVPAKSLTHTFPEWLITHPLVHHFMRGYFDGDGCFTTHKTKNTTQLTFRLLGTAQFLQTYLEILKQHCDLVIPNKSIYTMRKIHSLDFGGNNITKQIFDFLYKDATIYLERKYDLAASTLNAALIKPVHYKTLKYQKSLLP